MPIQPDPARQGRDRAGWIAWGLRLLADYSAGH